MRVIVIRFYQKINKQFRNYQKFLYFENIFVIAVVDYNREEEPKSLIDDIVKSLIS